MCVKAFICFSLISFFSGFQLDYKTTESLVSVDWENGFVESSAKNNENVTQVSFCKNLLSFFTQIFSKIFRTDIQRAFSTSKNYVQFKSSIAKTSKTVIATKSKWWIKYTVKFIAINISCSIGSTITAFTTNTRTQYQR